VSATPVAPATRPNVLCFSGLDPSGGAGIQADIEALFSAGCHCLPVVTALTVQDTRNVMASHPVPATLLIEQARAVLEDLPVAAIKIGLLGSVAAAEVIHSILRDFPGIPVVLDPILRAGGGFDFSAQELRAAMRSLLIPLSTVITPNTVELRLLTTAADSDDACANALLELGCAHVLLTGTHADSPNVVNQLYTAHQPPLRQEWPRLSGEYHGSGCTLAASLAAHMAHGLAVADAARRAQHYTWKALEAATRPGRGQHLPDRAFWSRLS
jgi:hydroxymethylpyrimidine/phosphomethylpyrimidine kinase